jgi:hypothetical protein
LFEGREGWVVIFFYEKKDESYGRTMKMMDVIEKKTKTCGV